MAFEERGEAVLIEDIALFRGHARRLGDLFGMTRDACHRMAATREFGENARSDLAGCADEGNFH